MGREGMWALAPGPSVELPMEPRRVRGVLKLVVGKHAGPPATEDFGGAPCGATK